MLVVPTVGCDSLRWYCWPGNCCPRGMAATIGMLGLWLLQAPRSVISGVEGPVEAPPPTLGGSEAPSGNGMRISGAVLTAVGGVFLVTGGSMFIAQARCQAWHERDPHASGECWWLLQGLWMAPVGLLVTSVGVPLLVVGQRRHKRWQAWRDRHALAPWGGRTATGWSVGAVLRF